MKPRNLKKFKKKKIENTSDRRLKSRKKTSPKKFKKNWHPCFFDFFFEGYYLSKKKVFDRFWLEQKKKLNGSDRILININK
jgi:hypothetical protein